jgi:hypothetical protein
MRAKRFALKNYEHSQYGAQEPERAYCPHTDDLNLIWTRESRVSTASKSKYRLLRDFKLDFLSYGQEPCDRSQ